MAGLQIFKTAFAPHRSRTAYLISPVIGVLVALAGPFGSYLGMSLLSRCLHFMFCFSAIGLFLDESVYRVARRYFAGRIPIWAVIACDLTLLVPMTLLVFASLRIFAPTSLAFIRTTDLLWQNALVIFFVRSLAVAGSMLRDAAAHANHEQDAREAFPLAEKLPFPLRHAHVVALSSEDHYLRVYTTLGEALIHMTLAEAVTALGGGFQIHRSHWISKSDVKAVKMLRVELSTGLSLPVSRHRRKAFESWLAPPR